MTRTIAETFDSHYRVDEITGCWIWLRSRKGKEAKSGGGYGCLRINGRLLGAHRFSYERAYGPLPADKHAAHQCHNTLCVNPEHLRAETNDENQHAKAVAGRAPAKLTVNDVATIRARVAAGEFQRVVAADYGLHQGDVSNIINHKYWKHVD